MTAFLQTPTIIILPVQYQHKTLSIKLRRHAKDHPRGYQESQAYRPPTVGVWVSSVEGIQWSWFVKSPKISYRSALHSVTTLSAHMVICLTSFQSWVYLGLYSSVPQHSAVLWPLQGLHITRYTLVIGSARVLVLQFRMGKVEMVTSVLPGKILGTFSMVFGDLARPLEFWE